MQRSAKIALAAVVIVILGGAAAFWWFVLRDDSPPPAALPVRTEDTTTTVAGAGPQPEAGSPDGAWTVAPAADVFVGYRIQELFAADTLSTTAVGRTPAVTGSLTIAGGQVTSAEITADLGELSSDRSQRDSYLRNSALETNTFPEATFRLTEPIALPDPVEVGTVSEITATGELTLHGVTRTVQIPLQASWNGSTISVAGGVLVTLADFDIEAPDISLVSVEGEGDLELQLVFERS